MSHKNEADRVGLSPHAALVEAAALLRRALMLLDSAEAPSELAARTQALIDALDEHTGS